MFFSQAIATSQATTSNIQITRCKGSRERVKGGIVRSKGPMVRVTNLSKNLKNLPTDLV